MKILLLFLLVLFHWIAAEDEGNLPVNNDAKVIKNRQQYQLYEYSVSKEGLFYKLGKEYETDKVTHHGYHRYYGRFIQHLRELAEDFAMIEIGMLRLSSLRTWLDYFPKLTIYGIDIGIEEQGDRYQIFKCDQSNLECLRSLFDGTYNSSNNLSQDNETTTTDTSEIVTKPFLVDKHVVLVIDDGSHEPTHQLHSFNYLFSEILMPGGVYIIEDIETSYWKDGVIYEYTIKYGYRDRKSIIEIFKHLIDDVNYEFLSQEDRKQQDSFLDEFIPLSIRKMVSSVTFGHNCIIIIKKTLDEVDEFDGRRYRYESRVN